MIKVQSNLDRIPKIAAPIPEEPPVNTIVLPDQNEEFISRSILNVRKKDSRIFWTQKTKTTSVDFYIDIRMYFDTDQFMAAQASDKRITANLPEKLLKEARNVTGKGITETIVIGLELIRRSRAYDKAQNLKGKIKIEIDLDVSRERPRN